MVFSISKTITSRQEKILGEQGQARARNLLRNFFGAKRVFQVDWMSEEYEGYVLNEVKQQYLFEPPPFWGHGLPIWQICARIQFYKNTSIRCRLIIFNPENKNDIWWQWLDILEQSKYFDTKGLKPRRVYPIDSFIKINPNIIKTFNL